MRAAPSFAVALAFAAACGGTTYHDGRFSGEPPFTITDPGAGYERVDVEGSNDLAFVRRSDGAILQANARCDPDLDIPLRALTMHLLLGFTDEEFVGEPVFDSLDGRESMRTHVLARLDGVRRELTLVVMKKNECVYDFAAIAAPGPAFESASADLDRMLGGFSTPGHP